MKQQVSATRVVPCAASLRAHDESSSLPAAKLRLRSRSSVAALQTAGVFATAAMMAFLAVGYVTSNAKLSDQSSRIRALEHDLADARQARQASELRLGVEPGPAPTQLRLMGSLLDHAEVRNALDEPLRAGPDGVLLVNVEGEARLVLTPRDIGLRTLRAELPTSGEAVAFRQLVLP